MRTIRTCHLPLVLTLIISLAVSSGLAPAAEMGIQNRADTEPAICDVRLTSEGVLRVRAVDSNGGPVSGKIAHVRRNGSPVAVETTDDEGNLSIQGLKGGVYEIEMEGHARMCRVWPAEMAPPAAIDSALLVIKTPVVRGQRPLRSLVNRRTLILGALVIAAIAIPLATDDSDSGS